MTVREITKEIDELFADTSIDIELTKERLRAIIEHAEMLLDTL